MRMTGDTRQPSQQESEEDEATKQVRKQSKGGNMDVATEQGRQDHEEQGQPADNKTSEADQEHGAPRSQRRHTEPQGANAKEDEVGKQQQAQGQHPNK